MVEPEILVDMLGPERFFLEQARAILEPGVAIGLAWTEAGGDVLYVEASLLPGTRGLRLTGQLGAVMRESARAAQTYVWSHAAKLGVNPKKFRQAGLHIHVPAGAVPKDGPSAGVTMATAVTSLYTGLAVRSHTAMTGEITLTGLVLPVGGIKEKVLAAHRAGSKGSFFPRPMKRTSVSCRSRCTRRWCLRWPSELKTSSRRPFPSWLPVLPRSRRRQNKGHLPNPLKEITSPAVFLYGGTV